ncbi:MAG: hypothetical protein ACOY31_09525 [Bacillota bacterium]
MGEADNYLKKGEDLLNILNMALENLKNSSEQSDAYNYRSYLHGQIYGIATALKMFFPGPGNLGEKAALALRPVITEHSCNCKDDPSAPGHQGM